MSLELRQRLALLIVLWLFMLYAMYSAFSLGPLSPEKVEGFPRFENVHDPLEHGYKIFFFSMIAAPLTYLAFTIVLVASILYLRSKELRWDTLAASSARIGILFTTILLVNGAIFSNLAWGAYWNWDPRQTTTLFLWFILAAYLSLRTAVDNIEARARLSAVLGIFGFIGVPLTHISATIWVSNHPQLYNVSGKVGFVSSKGVTAVFAMMVVGALILFTYMLWLTYRIENLRQEYQNALGGEV